MRTHFVGPFPAPARAALVLASLLLPAAAGFAESDDFDDGNDTGWTHYSPLTPFGAGAAYTFPSGAYRVKAPPSPAPAQVGPQRAGSLRPTSYDRALLAVDILNWDDAINQSLGLIARVSNLGLGTSNGYTYNYNTKSGYHQLTLVLGETPLSQIDESPFRLDVTRHYRMVFTLVDDKILGQTFSATNGVVPLHSVFGRNALYDAGTAGVFAFALDATGPIDARFDNYSATIPDKIRATILDASPAVGEQPPDPIATVVVRLASLETSVQTASIKLEIDGQPVAYQLGNTDPTFVLTHTPAAPLPANAAHTARVTFTDDDGDQTFSWPFGAPAVVAVPATLVGSPDLAGTFQKENAAVLDAGGKHFTIPIGPGQRFFRVLDSVGRKISGFKRTGDSLEIAFE